jgi:uncharacterized coiled-coil protein SlyX
MSVIEGLTTTIAQLEAQRETLCAQLQTVTDNLEKRKTLLAAYNVVSKDPVLYDQWVASVAQTPRPSELSDA